ncbi:hypothetical protein Efla_002311 [Eimeria flavescens]
MGRLLQLLTVLSFIAVHLRHLQLAAAERAPEGPGLLPDAGAKAHPHLLFQSPPSLLSLVEQAAAAESAAPGRCAAEDSACDRQEASSSFSPAAEGEKIELPLADLQGKPQGLKHEDSIPEVAFLRMADARRGKRQQVSHRLMQHEIRETFYAYPLFEAPSYKVHVHKHGQKQLLKDLHSAGAFNLKAASADEVERSTLAPSTYSVVQTALDVMCQDATLMELRAVARAVNGEVFCVKMTQIDMQETGTCLDVCLLEFSCPGAPVPNATLLKLEFDKSRLLQKTCTISETHELLEREFCEEGMALRFAMEYLPVWICMPKTGDWSANPKYKCIDRCGNRVPCLSPQTDIMTRGYAASAEDYVREIYPEDCKCNETGRGPNYEGCQTKTRLGKVCQKWNSQAPHPHEALKDQNHNYCRAPDGSSSIWCFTTDPEVRSDYCDPLGARSQVVYPGEVFDVVLEGRLTSANLELSFFKQPAADVENPCGSGSRSTDILLQRAPNSEVTDVIRQATEGRLSALIWKGAEVASTATGTYALCLCDYTSFFAASQTCTKDADYNLHAGWLHVKGPMDPALEFQVETGRPTALALGGFGYEEGDSMLILQSPYKCDASALRFTEAMSAMFGSASATGQHFQQALGMGIAIAAQVFADSVSTLQSSMMRIALSPFVISTPGDYELCWKSADGLCMASAGTLMVTGVELQRQFYALYVPTSGGSNNRPFPIFIAARGELSLPDQNSLFLSKVNEGEHCSGTVVGRPTAIVEYPTNREMDEKMIVAKGINLDNLTDGNGDTATTLEVCMDVDYTTTFLGNAFVGNSLIFPLSALRLADYGEIGIPKSVFSLTIPLFSSLGLHWSHADTDCFQEKNLFKFFTQGEEYPIALSFWVEEKAISVWHSSFSMPAPTAFAKFNIQGVLTLAVHPSTEGVIFYVARSNPGRIEKYDMTRPTHLSDLTPVATSSDTPHVSNPCGLAVLSGPERTLLLAVDSRTNKVILFDSDLNLVEAKSTWEGMVRPLSSSKSVYCINTPQSGKELFDCYITDPEQDRLLLIRYNTTTQSSLYITEVSESDENSQKLMNPQEVVAYPYNGFTLIYVSETRQATPMLLTKSDDQDKLRLVQRLESQSHGELEMLRICLLQTGEAFGGLDAVWLLSFHSSIDGPTVHAIPLDTTATAPNFQYTPREWYGLGEEHKLEPSIVGEASYSGLTGFSFDTSAHSYSFVERNLKLDKKTGTLTLNLIDIPESSVTIEILGTGIVNMVKTTFSFRVGCRDGHYYHQGMCVKCQTGTFNSLALVRESPSSYFHSCRPCGPHRSTVAEGSTSKEQCLCEKGFHVDEASPTKDCIPCPAGTYKDVVADTGCTGGGCPPHAISSVVGAVSANDRKCACPPGYYALYNEEELECREAEVGYFSLGGYNAERVECPPFTSTNPDAGLAFDLTYCLCEPGYEPADPESLRDPGSPASALKAWILLNPAYQGLDDSQVCMLCGRRAYKGTVSAESCTDCPVNSFASVYGPTTKSSCNMCVAGYYLTENEDMPCGECQANHFCVGSEPSVSVYEAFAGENTPCLDHTTSIAPYNKNVDPYSCMCTVGFEFAGLHQNTGKVMCEPSRLGIYKDTLGNVSGMKCPRGSNTLLTGSTSLSDCVCGAGFYMEEDTKTCKGCPIGAYCLGGRDHQTHEHRPYVLCPINTTTKYEESTSADDCLCDKGFYMTTTGSGGTGCVQCSINSYKDWIGSESCRQCSENSETKEMGSTSSVQCLCQAGYYYSNALRECIACKNPYKYCPGGETDCSEDDEDCVEGKKPTQPIDCPLHTRIMEGFDTPSVLDDCKCEKGYAFKRIDEELNSKICEPCNEGSYKSTVQDINCNGLCGSSSTSLAGAQAQVQCFCEEGTYFSSGACHSCPDGAVCLGGLRDSAFEALQKDPSYTLSNALLTTGYQLGSLIFNIVMAYMNVAAGFNRRSIHSIVIKIASNFLTCISVLTVVDFNQIAFPLWLKKFTDTVSETITQKEGSRSMMAVECLIREGFDLSYADSFFYTMLYNALLPVLLPFLVTFILFFMVRRFKHYYRNAIKKKLRLLDETEKYGLTNLTVQLREKYEEDRAFMMFRYIPIPGDSHWRRVLKFLEDMIPIYVTVVFFLYTATTRNMLSLLECTSIDFGGQHGSRKYLRAAMSVECEIDPTKDYFKFFALGITGLLLWSVGIPLAAFFVLYANRKGLNSRETRLKFGFLHNGFLKKYWYWETVVFARKFAVLFVSSICLTSTDSNGSKLWPACVTAVVFNIYHLRSQPFDKRSYSTLDVLENHSMAIWTIAVCVMLAITGSNLSGNVNLALAITICLAIVLFALEVAINLLYAYFDNVRANRSFFNVPVVGYVFRTFARWSEKRKTWEPIVVYDVDNDVIQLIAAKRTRRLKISKIRSPKKINSSEREYFLKVMAETLGFAVSHMKLDVLPGTFLEFVLRLGFAFHKLDEDTQENKKSLQAIAGGDISMLADWSQQQQRALARRQEALKDTSEARDSMDAFFEEVEKKIARKAVMSDSEEDDERMRDLEGGLSGSELDDGEEDTFMSNEEGKFA